MTDELDTPEARRLAAIEANYAEMRDLAETVDERLKIAKDLVHFYAVYSDENGQMEPEQDALNTRFLGAIIQLESRIVRIEEAIFGRQ